MLRALIDIGSNTIRMAIYQIKDGDFSMLMKKKHTVGLSGYVKDGVLEEEGMEKVIRILKEYQEFLSYFPMAGISAFTTAAIRNAKNRAYVLKRMEEATGLRVEVLSGDLEAELGFLAATRDFSGREGLIVDIGGGSTELVAFKNGKIEKKISLELGSLAFSKRYIKNFLPDMEEMKEMQSAAREKLLEAEGFEGLQMPEIIGIGGAATGTRALFNELYGEEKRNKKIKLKLLSEILLKFIKNTPKNKEKIAEKRISLLSEEESAILMRAVPERMHNIFAGICILQAVAEKFGAKNMIYSNSGVREGYLYAEKIKK